MTRSIFGRIFLSNCIVIIITAVTCLLFSGYLIHRHMTDYKKDDLLAKGQAVISLIVVENQRGHQQLQNNIDRINELVGATCWIVDANSSTITGQPPDDWQAQYPVAPEKIAELANGNLESWMHRSKTFGDRSILLALPIPDTHPAHILLIHASTPRVTKQVNMLEPFLLYGSLAGLMIAAILAFFISRSLTSPIANISEAAKRFSRGDYTARTTAVGQGEIGRLGRTLNAMAESLAFIEQNRREFLANVTHELKTPVASIQAMTEALIDKIVPPKQQTSFLGSILQATQRMTRLINDLLDLSRLEAGEMAAVQETIDLSDFLANQLRQEKVLFQEKEVHLQVEVTAKDLCILADSGRLSQILSNLLSNALRYSPPHSTVTITASRQNQQALIRITDQGKGIAPEDILHIWDRFYRSDKSRSRDDGGTGLGLSITKHLVELMGGHIEVVSPPGHGATFTIFLPVLSRRSHMKG